jgi:hypothetical protein
MNQNELARTVALLEGGKVNLPIGQVKEVIRITLNVVAQLAVDSPLEFMKMINQHLPKGKNIAIVKK